MKCNYIFNIVTICSFIVLGITDISFAESLAGNVGQKRFSPTLSGNPKDACTKTYAAYIAASGHSAYATTPYYRTRDLYIICGARFNAPTQKIAEELALKSCQATRKHYKVTTAGNCAIAASK